MPSYAQLQTEVWWANEFQPPSLAELCRNLRGFFQVGADALGSKGDNNHLYGYHRSRAWILSSAWSAYGKGDYSVQAAEDRGGDGNWLAAVDFTPGDADTMITVCQRLDAAVKAGKTPQLREWYGNVDGDQVVDGWDLLYDRAATSDSSHLWHLHMSFLRSRAGDDHSNLYAILTGAEEDDMALTAIQTRDVNGDTVLMFPWNGTWRRVPKSDNPWILNNSLTALTLAGVGINSTTWPGPYNFSDPATWAWAGFEVKPEGAVTFSPADLAKVAEAAKAGAEAGAPTKAELEDAAFAGSQRAEKE